MELTPTKPARKFRRAPIVAFVLMLAATVLWSNWPRGDARFIGKWAMSDTLPASTPHATMILARNGVGSSSLLAGGEAGSFPWYVVGNRLVMGNGTSSSAPYLKRVQQWFQSAFGGSPISPAHSWEILEVNKDSFLIRAFATHRPIRCTRLSE